MHEIVIASNNQGKITEFTQILAPLGIKVIPQAAYNVTEIDEPFPTFIENALHKARHCSKSTNLPALADDSGLCVMALGGAPGIYSARYAGTDKNPEANINQLLAQMQGKKNRAAYFYCGLVLVQSHLDPSPIIAEGRCYGEITTQRIGTNGFGYDPIFYLSSYAKTMAELTMIQKNQISHRAIALKNLHAQISQNHLAP